jgi:hypothetical protein
MVAGAESESSRTIIPVTVAMRKTIAGGCPWNESVPLPTMIITRTPSP